MKATSSPFFFIQNTTTQQLSGALTIKEAVAELAKIRLLSTDSAVIVDNDLCIVPQSEWLSLVSKIVVK